MIKSPLYILPLVTAYFFSVGFFYDAGTLNELGFRETLFLPDYSSIMQHSLYAFVMMILDNTFIFVLLSFTFAFIVCIKKSWLNRFVFKIYKFLLKHRLDAKVIKTVKAASRCAIMCYVPMYIFLFSLYLPYKVGANEAINIKSRLNTVWHEIKLKGEDKYKEGFIVRTYHDYILFREKSDNISHLFPINEIKDIRVRSKE